MFAFAGLWDGWSGSNGQWVKDLHDPDDNSKRRDFGSPRQNASDPPPDAYHIWLDPGMQNVAAISELLKPCVARVMRCHQVSTRVEQCGERGVFATCGDCHAESAIRLVRGQVGIVRIEQHLPYAIRLLFPHRQVLSLVGDSLP
jgi:hypothetical protein